MTPACIRQIVRHETRCTYRLNAAGPMPAPPQLVCFGNRTQDNAGPAGRQRDGSVIQHRAGAPRPGVETRRTCWVLISSGAATVAAVGGGRAHAGQRFASRSLTTKCATAKRQVNRTKAYPTFGEALGTATRSPPGVATAEADPRSGAATASETPRKAG